jgi:hypothetical protein
VVRRSRLNADLKAIASRDDFNLEGLPHMIAEVRAALCGAHFVLETRGQA